MSEQPAYTPPRVWAGEKPEGDPFAAINRPVAGAMHEATLPVGRHPLQLYSIGSPNGQKVTILLEELLAAGHSGAEYDAWLINILAGEQYSTGFIDVNPNGRIPALVDTSVRGTRRVFESGSILLYLAEKFGAFLPRDAGARTEAISWLFWQMASSPLVSGGFGHFFAYAPVKNEYAINRFTMETKRQLDVLDRRLADNSFFAGDEYSIADIAIWPGYGALVLGRGYPDAAEFLDVQSYTNLIRWAKQIDKRDAVVRGRIVNKAFGDPSEQLHERHDASDFDLRTQDKLEASQA